MTKTRTTASAAALDANRAAELAAFDARHNGADTDQARAAYDATYAAHAGTVAAVAYQQPRKSLLTRMGRWAVGVSVAVAAFALLGAVVPGDAAAVTRDSGIWASPTLTVHVADEGAWSGTDVQSALAQWAPVMRMTVTDDADADVTLDTAPLADYIGANTKRSTVGGVIRSCRVDLQPNIAGTDATHILAHEIGHCLGLHDSTLADTHEPTVMYWMSAGNFSAERVTPADLDAVRALYR